MSALGLLSLAQGVYGAGEKIAAGFQRRKAEDNFQNFKIPSSVDLMLNKAQGLASQTELPGSDIYRMRAGSNASQAIESSERSGRSSSDVLGQLSSSEDSLNKFYQDIAAKGGAYYQENQAMLQGTLEKYGNYETERWKYNELMPYMQAMQRAGDMDSAGNANIGSAIGAGMSLLSSKKEIDNENTRYQEWLDRQFPKKQ